METCIARMQVGNMAMVLCCIFYLVWWSIAFNPNRDFPMSAKVVLFLFTFAAGLVGAVLLVQNMGQLPKTREGISNTAIVTAGIGIYLILLFLTSQLMHRQVTTELALIVGWTVLEACVVNALYRAEAIGSGTAIAAVVVIVVGAAIAMVCYLAYYNLPAQTAFYDGMVPLILLAVVEVFLIVLVWRCTGQLLL